MPTPPRQRPQHTVRLIVNADDLGAGDARDRGIFAAYASGSVTSVSLLANGPTTAAAATAVLRLRIPCGIHLNLAEGQALCGPIAGLTTADGHFPGKEESRRIFAAATFDHAAAQNELAAQFTRLRSLGVVPDHFDTHQHTLLFPALTPLVVAAAVAAGVTRARLPLPAEARAADPDGALGDELSLYRRLAPAAKQVLHDAGIVTPEGLFGMPLLNRLDATALRRLLAAIPDGTWELMVHPGEVGDHDPFGGTARRKELHALHTPAVRRALGQFKLMTFAELPCAC